MTIKDIYIPFQHRDIDFGITVQSFSVDEETNTIEIEDYEISLTRKGARLDDTSSMIKYALDNGRRYQEVLFDTLSEEDMERINETLLQEWEKYWEDAGAEHSVLFENYKQENISES